MELESCKQALKENDLSNVANIVLLHLSSNNSDEHLFVSEVQNLLERRFMLLNQV